MSGLATLHLVVMMVEDLIGTIRLLVTAAPFVEPPAEGPPSSQPSSPDWSRARRVPRANLDANVLGILQAQPGATWRSFAIARG